MVSLKEKHKLNIQFFSESSSDQDDNVSSTTEVTDNNLNLQNEFEVEECYVETFSRTGEQIITAQQQSASKKILSSIYDIVEIFAYAIAMMVIVFLFVIKFVTVDGTSMLNTLQHKDRLIVYNLFYTPEKNDIIVINYEERNELLVKRVIGTEGDKVKINFRTWEVFVNDELLPQPYIADNVQKLEGRLMADGNMTPDENGCVEFVVEKDKIFVMGDNRNASLDSRSIGQLDVDEIIGKVVFRVAPFDNMGTFE
jgi:signal peptidase I